jgi:putative transport protein
VLVSNKAIVNKTLYELNLRDTFHATVTRIRRSGIDIAPTPDTKIRLGDKLMIACDKEHMDQVIKLLGNDDRRLSETNVLPIFLGITLGILAGQIRIPIGNFTFTLGITGGIIAVGILLSKLGKTGPIIWAVPGPANQLLRQMGLLFFLSAVGTKAGSQLMATVNEYGVILLLLGALITLIPMIIAVLLGHYIFKINFLTLLGIITGGMTSSPGLAAVTSLTDSNAPCVAYAAVYPFALVSIIFFTKLIV